MGQKLTGTADRFCLLNKISRKIIWTRESEIALQPVPVRRFDFPAPSRSTPHPKCSLTFSLERKGTNFQWRCTKHNHGKAFVWRVSTFCGGIFLQIWKSTGFHCIFRCQTSPPYMPTSTQELCWKHCDCHGNWAKLAKPHIVNLEKAPRFWGREALGAGRDVRGKTEERQRKQWSFTD